MSLKDHPVFFVVAACAATAASTWAASEKLRVTPIKEKLIKEEVYLKSAPIISDVGLIKVKSESGQMIEQNISFIDPEGDAFFVNFAVLGSNMSNLSVSSASFAIPAEAQKKGSTYLAKWNCGASNAYVTFRVTITDRSGNVSKPVNYTVNCDG